MVVPHAGYQYSGSIAGAVYSRVRFPDTFVILGPNHYGLGAVASMMPEGLWTTPLGSVSIDAELARRILDSSQFLEVDSLGHSQEHAIEVQLPLLQAFEIPFRFVPIALMPCPYHVCQDIGEAVATAIQASDPKSRVTMIASTDFTHCGPMYHQLPPPGMTAADYARQQDRLAIEAILALDPERLYRTVEQHDISMCGVHATTAMLVAANLLGGRRAELVGYRTSADVTGEGDMAVGYAGVVIHPD